MTIGFTTSHKNRWFNKTEEWVIYCMSEGDPHGLIKAKLVFLWNDVKWLKYSTKSHGIPNLVQTLFGGYDHEPHLIAN